MFDYEIEETKIQGVKIINISQHLDYRGEIFSLITPELQDELNVGSFKHQKIAINKKNVLRGIHGDYKSWKMIFCLRGEIQQVVVDNRKNSKTYKEHISIKLNQNDKRMLLMPPGAGNAFKTLSDDSIYFYALAYEGKYNDWDEQFTIKYDDQELAINWEGDKTIVSERDS